MFSKNNLIYFQQFMNVARGVQKSAYNQQNGKQILDKSIQYKGLFTKSAGRD